MKLNALVPVAKTAVKDYSKKALIWTKKNAPTIFTSLGVAGFFTAGVLTVPATIRAVRAVDEAIEEKGEPLTKKEIFLISWKYYLASSIIALLSSTSIIVAHRGCLKTNAALLTALKLKESTLNDVKQKIADDISKGKVKKIEDSIARDQLNKQKQEDVINTGYGTYLFMDAEFGTLFRINKEVLLSKVDLINERAKTAFDGSQSLNDFRYELNIPCIGAGNKIGFTIDKPLHIDIRYDESPWGEPCAVIHYDWYII